MIDGIPMDKGRPFINPWLMKLPEDVIPFGFKPTDQYSDKFNSDPVNCFIEIVQRPGMSVIPPAVANLLFFENFTPHALAKVLFNSALVQRRFLRSFFRAPSLEFFDFVDALRILVSRIAFPNDRNDLISVLTALGAALHANGVLEGYSCRAVTFLASVCLYHSLMIDDSNRRATFLDMCMKCAEVKAIPKERLHRILDDLESSHLETSFTFSDPRYPPRYDYEGSFVVKGKRKKKKLNGVIHHDSLMLYDKQKQVRGGIPLMNIVFVHPLKDDPLAFRIDNANNDNVGFTVKRGKSIPSGSSSMPLGVESIDEVEKWRSALMHVAFKKVLGSMLLVPQWATCE